MFREIPEYSRFVARWLKMNDDGDVDGSRLISSQCGTWFLKEWGNERRLQCLTDEYLCVDDIRFTKGLQLFISSYTTTTNTSTNNLMQYWQQKVTSLLLTTLQPNKAENTQYTVEITHYTEPSMIWHCWLGGRKGIWPVKNWLVGCWHVNVIMTWLSLWSKLRTCIWPSRCHCHSPSLASVKSRLVLPFWYRLTWIGPDKGPLYGCHVCYSEPQVMSHKLLLTLEISGLPSNTWSLETT